VHWKTEQQAAKARAKAATTGGKTGEARWEIDQRKRQEQHAREEAELKRWNTARPAILQAVAAKVKTAPARAKGLLADIVLGKLMAREYGMRPMRDLDAVPRGTSAEDLIRHAAFLVLQAEATGWGAPREFPKRAKAFGVDARKILEEVAPAASETPSVQTSAAKATKSGKKGKGKAA
jgi:hypothetical protein